MKAPEKEKFQDEIKQAVTAMSSNDETVNDGQLLNTLVYVHYKGIVDLEPEEVLKINGMAKTLRILYAYHTLAISLNSADTWAAAMEVFPFDDVSIESAPIALRIFEHLQQEPGPIQAALAQGVSDSVSSRLALLRSSLSARLI